MGRPALATREVRVSLLIGTGHFLSHFYALCLPPLFIAWQQSFHANFAMLGLVVALVAATTAILQTPVGFLVDRYGARWFLVAGAGLMAASIAAMGTASAYWQILAFAVCAGVGNSVIHPCDYAILSGAIGKAHTGKAFSLHTFAGNSGFAAGPPVTIGLASVFGWRLALIIVGGLGILLVGTILWQSQILTARPTEGPRQAGPKLPGRQLLLTPVMLCFLGFYVMSAMAGAGLQAWLITVLHQIRGMDLTLASWLLTLYVIGLALGALVGGWLSDRTDRYLFLVVVLILPAAALIAVLALVPLPRLGDMLCIFSAGTLYGTSRTPRDMMVRRASPRGQVGTVFGFVSAGLPLGSALTPVPFGFLIGMGWPATVLVLVAALMAASVLVAMVAETSAERSRIAIAAEAAE